MNLTLFGAVLNKSSPTFCVCPSVLHSCNNKPCKPFMRNQRQTERADRGQTVSMCVSACSLSLLIHLVSSLWSPEFPGGPAHFTPSLCPPPYLLLSLLENAPMLNLSQHAHTKNTRHSQTIYPPSTPFSFVFVAFCSHVIHPLHSLLHLWPFLF